MGQSGPRPPAPSAPHRIFSPSREQSRAGFCAPSWGPRARSARRRRHGPSPAGTLPPQRAEPGAGGAGGGSGGCPLEGLRPGGGPSPGTFYPGRRSTRRRRRHGQRAQRPCWAAAGRRLRGSARSASARRSPLPPARLPPVRLCGARACEWREGGRGGPEGRAAGTGRAQAPALRTALRRPRVGSPQRPGRRRGALGGGDPAGGTPATGGGRRSGKPGPHPSPGGR